MNRATPIDVISMSDVNTELGLSGVINMSDLKVRELAGIPDGPISMSHLRGKSSIVFPPNCLTIDVTSAYQITISGYCDIVVDIHGTVTKHTGNDIVIDLKDEEGSPNWSICPKIYHDTFTAENRMKIYCDMGSTLTGVYSSNSSVLDNTIISSESEMHFGDSGNPIVFKMPNLIKLNISTDAYSPRSVNLDASSFAMSNKLNDLSNAFECCYVNMDGRVFANCPITNIDSVFKGASLTLTGDSDNVFMDKALISANYAFMLNTCTSSSLPKLPKLWTKFNHIPHAHCYCDYEAYNYSEYRPFDSSLGVPDGWY